MAVNVTDGLCRRAMICGDRIMSCRLSRRIRPPSLMSAPSSSFRLCCGGWKVVADFCQSILFGKLSMIQIPSQLQVHPKVGCHAEKFSQSQSRTGSDSPATMDDLIDSLIGDVNRVRQFTLSHPHRQQELLEEHLPRMRGRAISGHADHSITLFTV